MEDSKENNEITTDDVIRGIDIFADIDELVIKEKIRQATLKVVKDKIADDAKSSAILAYSRHLLLQHYFASNGGITSGETLGQQFTNVDLTKSDPFLDDYKQIASDFGNTGSWKVRFV